MTISDENVAMFMSFFDICAHDDQTSKLERISMHKGTTAVPLTRRERTIEQVVARSHCRPLRSFYVSCSPPMNINGTQYRYGPRNIRTTIESNPRRRPNLVGSRRCVSGMRRRLLCCVLWTVNVLPATRPEMTPRIRQV